MKPINHPYGNFKILFIKTFKKFLKDILKLILSVFFKFDKHDEIIISSATHAPWLKDIEFLEFYRKIKNLTLLDEPRAYTLWQCSKNLENYNGNILDVGCLLGGSGFLMSKANKKGSTYLFDTFSGFENDDGLHKKNTFFFDDIKFVSKNIKKFKLKNTHVKKLQFPKKLGFNLKKIKLCHIDVNTYKETKNVFLFVNDRIIKGGIIIFDDYGIWGVDGIKNFINQIYPKFKKNYYFLKNYMGQCLLIKKY